MKPDKHFITAVGVFLATASLIGLTWVGTNEAIRVQHAENLNRVSATLASQALSFTEQVNRQLLAIDQTLRIIVTAWEANPKSFDLEAWQRQAVALTGLSRDMLLTDENGIIRQSSVNEAINQNAAGLDYFRGLANPKDLTDGLYIGPAAIDGIMRQWHMNVARALHRPDGSFAGVIDADYRIAAITDVFSQIELGTGTVASLVGLEDGKLRGAVGPVTIDPGASIGETAMFVAVQGAESGIWTGPSASDAEPRIHAFRHIPNRRLAVVVGMTEQEALRPAAAWRRQAQFFAGCITALLGGFGLFLIQGTRLARRRKSMAVADRAMHAASNAHLEVARALASAKAEQLEATLAGMSDGVSMIDAHLCLVEWNARFPEIAGVPAEILRVGLPMEEILRAQIMTGQFGRITDPGAEVARRLARLRVAPYGVVQRQRPDGHTIELRRNRLPDGGFVTLYADITEHKQAEDALRKAQVMAETANAEKSRFIAIVSHEIRTPLNALLNTVRLLSDSVLPPAQQSLLAMARHSGDVLFGLINDILDISQMEAGKLSIRPSLFELRRLLDSCAEMFAAPARERGITIKVMITEGTPDTLLTDPGRLRQVQLNLLSNAVKYAGPGEVWLIAEPGKDASDAVRLTVRDDGPVITPGARERLFRPFSRLDRVSGDEQAGTGLGLSICQHLVTLMGGRIGCRPWGVGSGREGNAFWMTLPATALAMPVAEAAVDRQTLALVADNTAAPAELPRRRAPRTRILLADEVVANQHVTALLLRREGHHVDVVGSGPAAIEALRNAPYDLVFMDIYMPGMSGQETTRIIRALPEPACSTLIVALTANVSPQDESIFRAAGMDGILGKPVRTEELLDVLYTHVWAGAAAGQTDRPADTEAPNSRSNTGPLLSADRIAELRTNLSPLTFANLIEECLLDMNHRLPALRRALALRAPGAIASHAHALVGMAGGYGMAALETRLRSIMDAARSGDLMRLDAALIVGVEQDFEQTARSLRAMLRVEVV